MSEYVIVGLWLCVAVSCKLKGMSCGCCGAEWWSALCAPMRSEGASAAHGAGCGGVWCGCALRALCQGFVLCLRSALAARCVCCTCQYVCMLRCADAGLHMLIHTAHAYTYSRKQRKQKKSACACLLRWHLAILLEFYIALILLHYDDDGALLGGWRQPAAHTLTPSLASSAWLELLQ
jgi:hypothetical protein